MIHPKKIILALMACVIFPIALACTILLFVWSFPQIVINARTLPWLIARVAGSSSKFHSQKIDIAFQKPNFWSRTILLSLENGCFENDSLFTCFSGNIEADIRLRIRDGLIIPRVLLHAADLYIDLDGRDVIDDDQTPTSPRAKFAHVLYRFPQILSFFESRQLDDLDLRLSRVRLKIEKPLPEFGFSFVANRLMGKATLSFQTQGPAQIQTQECELVWLGQRGTSQLSGPCEWKANLPDPIQRIKIFKRPDIRFQSTIDIRFQNGRLAENSQVELVLDPQELEGLKVQSRFWIDRETRTRRLPIARWEIKLLMERLQKAKPLLSRLDIEVPAPFHVMDGGLAIQCEGSIPMPSNSEANFSVNAHLASAEQKLRMEGSGRARLGNQRSIPFDLSIEGGLDLKEVELVAPPLQFHTLPTLLPDRRFRGESRASKKSKLFNIEFDFQIRTERPILIKSDLTLTPIPISLDLRFQSSKSTTGNIRVHRVGLDLLRRDIKLRELVINFHRADRPANIQGEIRVRSAGYLVFVLLDGDFHRPRIQLRSEPPLPENDIYAVLLFGRPLDLLGMEDVNSVASFKGAAVARAITLASLYFLVATPIQSITFNPQTLAFSATVRLPRNMALHLGVADEGSRFVGLRKRIGREFYLETEVRNPADIAANARGGALSTYLIWFKRY